MQRGEISIEIGKGRRHRPVQNLSQFEVELPPAIDRQKMNSCTKRGDGVCGARVVPQGHRYAGLPLRTGGVGGGHHIEGDRVCR